jgi:hypothetical protein
MARPKQRFIAPGPEEEALPIEASPWHFARIVEFPREHWFVILELVERVHGLERREWLERYAYPADDELLPDRRDGEAMIEFLRALQAEIRAAPPLVPEVTEELLENFTNEEHARMLAAMSAVIAEALLRGEPFIAGPE